MERIGICLIHRLLLTLLIGVNPKVGMEIDVCDKEYVWSSAIIVKIFKGKTTKCKIRYKGWGPEWDEVLVWGNNERLARNLYFTTRALCIVDLKMGKKCFWPCIANLRMPNPKCSLEARLIGEESLRQEQTVFIQPYGLKDGLFTKHIAQQFTLGGKWMKTNYIAEWKSIDEITAKSNSLKNFEIAFESRAMYVVRGDVVLIFIYRYVQHRYLVKFSV